MNSSRNSEALALKLPYFPFDPRHLTGKRFLDHRGLTLTARNPPNVATADSGLTSNLAVNAAKQLKAENFGRDVVIWCRNTGAHYEIENIPAFITESREKLRMVQKRHPGSKPGSLPRWAERITTAREKLRLTQAEFALALGVGQGNVSKWEHGTNRPLPDIFVKIAALVPGPDKFFFWEEAGLPSEYFEGTAEKTMPTELVRATTKVIAQSFAPVGDRANKTADAALVPLLSGAAAAGNPRAIDATDVEEYLPYPKKLLPSGGTIVAVRVAGDSMAPLVNEGYTVLIDLTDRDPKKLVGKMVVAHNGEGVTVKFLRKDKEHFLLVPYNVSPRHEVMVFRPKDGWTIIGSVVSWIGKPAPFKK